MNRGRWRPGFEAQDEMLDEFMKENKLEKMDWRPEMYQPVGKVVMTCKSKMYC